MKMDRRSFALLVSAVFLHRGATYGDITEQHKRLYQDIFDELHAAQDRRLYDLLAAHQPSPPMTTEEGRRRLGLALRVRTR